jgi:ABC-type transporter Mla MlaB component
MARKRTAAGKKGVRVALVAELTIRNAAPQKAALAEALGQQGDTIVLDGSAVGDVDTAGVQLVAAFVRAVHVAGRKVEWVQPPRALRDASAALGVESALAFPVQAA